MNIRNATKDDLEGVCSLSNEINADHYISMPEDFIEPDGSNRDEPYWLSFISAENSRVFVAEHDGVLVGAVAVTVTSLAPYPFLVPRPRGHLATIVVARNHQGRGIGRGLMRAAEAFAKDNGADDIKLEVMAFNSNALNFYKEIGYGDFSYRFSKSLT